MTSAIGEGAAIEHPPALTPAQRRTVLAAAFLCWLCAGVEMGLTQLTTAPRPARHVRKCGYLGQ